MAKLKSDYISWTLQLKADGVQKEIHKITEANQELKESNKTLRKEMRDLEKQGKAGTAEYKNLSESIKKNNQELRENGEKLKQLESRLDKTTMSTAQLEKQAKRLRTELKNTVKSLEPEKYRALEKELSQTERALSKSADASKGFWYSLTSLNRMGEVIKGTLWSLGLIISGQIIDTFKSAINIIIDFEAENSKLAAILGTTKEGVKDLTDQAKELGATTSYTASEVTKLQIELAKLGFAKDQIAAMTPEVLKFAKAVDTDLGSAAALTGAALRIFGLEAEDTGRIVSTMAIGTTKSALSFSYLESALSTVGPVANAFGFTIEETTALLGALANSGFDASSAATATRNIMLNMADSSGKLAKALGQPVKNLDDLVNGLHKLEKEGVDLSEALELTDKRSVAAFQTFLHGSETLKELKEGVTDCTEAFDSMVDEMSDNVRGSLNILQSTLEGLVLRFYESKGAIKFFIDLTVKMIEYIGKGIDYINKYSVVFYPLITYLISYNLALKLNIAERVKSLALAIKQRVAAIAQTTATIAETASTNGLTAAMKALRIEMLKNPYTAITAAVLALGVAIWQLTSKTRELTEAEKAENEAKKKANDEYNTQSSNIKTLVKLIEDENIGTTKRKELLEELNGLLPDFNIELSKEGKITAENKKKLDEYLKSLREEIKLKAYKDKLTELEKKKADKEDEIDDQVEVREKAERVAAGARFSAYNSNKLGTSGARSLSYNQRVTPDESKAREERNKENKLREELQDIDDAIEKINGKIAKSIADTAKSAEGTVSATSKSMIKDLEDQKKKVEGWDESTEAAIKKKNKEIERIDKEIRRLKNLGTSKEGTEDGNKKKKSATDQALKQLKAEHDERMAQIEKQGREEQKLRTTIDMELAKEQERYAQARIDKIKELGEKTKAANTEELTKQKEAQAKADKDMIAALEAQENIILAKEKENRDKRIEIENAYYQQQKATMDQALKEGKINKGAYDAYMLEVERAHREQLKQIAHDYLQNIEETEIYSDEKRAQLRKEANAAAIAADNEALAARANAIQKIREMEQANPIGLAGMTQQRDRMIADVQATYDAMIQVAQQAGLDTVELERQKQAEISQINYEYQEQVYQLQQELGVTWAQEYDNELAKYKQLLNQEYISEEQFQKKKLQLQTKNVKKYFDYYSGLSSSMVDAIQQYEMDAVDAKYDVLIREAENNGEDTAELEEQKENEKLEIQKKYADVNFAVKCSQIIADTAVSIMMAYSQLGPIAGSVAAALMGVTGAMQLASAKAERDRIKNMQPSKSNKGSSSSKSTPTASRTVKSGYAEGGYTGDGGRYEVAGYVHKGEYVVPQPIMDDPRVVDAVGTIEAIRRQRSNNNPMPGYADGGPVGDQPETPAPGAPGTREIREAARDIKEAAASIRKVKAYIVYQDFEKSKDTIEKARDIFTRNK